MSQSTDAPTALPSVRHRLTRLSNVGLKLHQHTECMKETFNAWQKSSERLLDLERSVASALCAGEPTRAAELFQQVVVLRATTATLYESAAAAVRAAKHAKCEDGRSPRRGPGAAAGQSQVLTTR